MEGNILLLISYIAWKYQPVKSALYFDVMLVLHFSFFAAASCNAHTEVPSLWIHILSKRLAVCFPLCFTDGTKTDVKQRNVFTLLLQVRVSSFKGLESSVQQASTNRIMFNT